MPITPATSIDATALLQQGAGGEFLSQNDIYVGNSAAGSVRQYAMRSPLNVSHFDDFVGGAIASVPYVAKKGSDGSAAFPAIVATAANGTARLTTGAGAGATMAVNGSQLLMELNTKLSNGVSVLEAAIGNISSIANLCLFFGWSDQNSALQMPGTVSGTTFTAVGTDLAGFIYDTSATNAFYQSISTNNSTVKALTTSAVAPSTTTFNRLRIETTAAGDVSFYIDGVLLNTITTGIRASVGLTPTIAAFARTSASKTVDVDYLHYHQQRGY